MTKSLLGLWLEWRMLGVFLVCFLSLISGAVMAQDWQLRTGDAPLSQIQAQDLTSGRTLTFYDNGRAKFSVGGAYSYTYANNGGTAFGRFDVSADGKVCIAFANGFGRCDMFVHNDGWLVMLTENGERFPIRPK